MMEIGEIKKSDKFGKMKDDNEYFLGIMGDNFQDRLINLFCIMKEMIIESIKRFCHWQMNSNKKWKKWNEKNIYNQLV